MSDFDRLVSSLEDATRAAKNIRNNQGSGGSGSGGSGSGGSGSGGTGGGAGGGAGGTTGNTGTRTKTNWRDTTGNYGEYGKLFGKEFEEKFYNDALQASRELFRRYGRRLVDVADDATGRIQIGTNQVFTRLSERLREFSVDAGEAFQDISRDAPGTLTYLSTLTAAGGEAGRKSALQLLTTIGQFRELSAQAGRNAMDIADSMTMAFEQPADRATSLLFVMRDMTAELGITTEKLTEDYLYLSKNLAYSIEEINKQFRKLEVQSRTTGIPVRELTQAFGKQLDTFEGSATAAGRLNAILGTSSINALELLTMKEGERVEYIKGAMQSAGVSLAEITKGKGFGLRAISEAVGLDLENTRRLLSGKSEEVFQTLGGEELSEKDINAQLSQNTLKLDTNIDRLSSEIRASHGVRTQLYLEMRRANDLAVGKVAGVDPDDYSRVEALMTKFQKELDMKVDTQTGEVSTAVGRMLMEWGTSITGDAAARKAEAAALSAAIGSYQAFIDGALSKKGGPVLGGIIASVAFKEALEEMRKTNMAMEKSRAKVIADAISGGIERQNWSIDTAVYLGDKELTGVIKEQAVKAVKAEAKKVGK